MSQLTSLPDVCMFNIYARLYIHDQLHLGQTCHRFRVLQLSAHKKPFKLMISDSNFYWDECDPSKYIQLKTISRDICDKIVKQFPNAVELEIRKPITNGAISIESIINLLTIEVQDCQWSSKLVSLALFRLYRSEVDHSKCDYLLSYLTKSINSLSSLKYLTLDNSLPPTQLCNLTILPQLKHFEYSSSDGENQIIKLFQKYSESILLLDQLKSIQIYNCNFIYYGVSQWTIPALRKLFKLDSKLTCRFTEFGPIHPRILNDFLFNFCSHFPSLKTIDIIRISSNEPSLVQRLNCLSSLKQITNLRLYIDRPISIDHNQIVRPLTSLKQLRLLFIQNYPKKIKNLNFSQHFPNLQTVVIAFPNRPWPIKKCSICDESFVASEEPKDILDHEKICLLDFIEPMKACQQLFEIQTVNPTSNLLKPFELTNFKYFRHGPRKKKVAQ